MLTIKLQVPSALQSNNADPMPEKMRNYGINFPSVRPAMRKDFAPTLSTSATATFSTGRHAATRVVSLPSSYTAVRAPDAPDGIAACSILRFIGS